MTSRVKENLRDKAVVITGAAGGLGTAYAEAFGAAGAKLVLVDNGVSIDGAPGDAQRVEALAESLRQKGYEAIGLSLDVATREGAEAAIARATESFNELSVLVTSTGILLDKTLLKLSDGEWDRVNDACLRATFLTTQAFAKHVVRHQNGARIVHTVSLQGLTGSLAQGNFAAANSGIFGFMRSTSIELQKHKVTVNAVAPLAKTRMTEHLPMFHGVTTLTPEHVVPAVLYLGSDLVGQRTGHLLAVAGARMFAYKFVETNGVFKEEANGVWTPEEIRERWDSIVK